jgi:hypothetical protein
MEITKLKVLSLLKQNLNEMAMEFSTNDRPSSDVERNLSNNDTPLTKIPFPSTGNENSNFQELLASERYRQVVENVKRYTNMQGTVSDKLPQLTMLMMQAHNKITRIESNHKEALEELAKKIVSDEVGLNEDDLNLNAKIVPYGSINNNDFNLGSDEDEIDSPVDIDTETVEVELELYDDLQDLDIERAKRRLINALIQGASKKGHYMYHLVSEELRNLTGSDELMNLYGVMMSINDLVYWQLSDEQMGSLSNSVAGKSNVNLTGGNGDDNDDNEDDEYGGEEFKPEVSAVGVNFPVLIHELLKGVYETLGAHGLPTDQNMHREVTQHEDTLEKEMWDLRLGPAIWDRMKNQFPDEVFEQHGKEIQNHMFMHIFKLPAREFLIFMKEVISGSENGARLMFNLMESVKEKLQNQDYEDSINEFNNELSNISDNTDDDEFTKMLNDLGLSVKPDDLGNNDNEDEEDDEDFLNQFR